MNTAQSSFKTLGQIVGILHAIATSYIRRRLCMSVLLVVATSVIAGLVPLTLKKIVDALGHPGDISTNSVFLIVALYISGQWLMRALNAAQTVVQAQADRRMSRALSDRLFDHIMRLPLRYHLERQTGALNETVTNGLSGYQTVLYTLLFSLLPVVVQLATVTTVLLKLHEPLLLGMFLIALVCYAAAFAHGATHSTVAAREALTAQVDARAIMTDSVLNAETVKYFTAEQWVRERLDRALFRTETEWVRYSLSRTFNSVLIATIFAGFLAATIFYAVHEVLHGKMTVGTFVLINAYMFQLVSPLEVIGSAIQQLAQGCASVEKMLELLGKKPEPAHDRAHRPYSGPGKLQFDRISVAYREDRKVLKDVNFTLPPGKTLGVVGASGAGKSTLVRLLVRLIDPDSGRILIDDIPLSELPLASLRDAIAVVPQDTVLFNDTLRYNIGFGKPGSTDEEIETATKLAELHEFVMSLPDRYDTRVGERGTKLSGGERQRVSIARAALKCPRIYVFDEATSSLDSRTEREILHNLRRISAQTTTLVIAHRLSTVLHADEIIVLDNGAVVERGTHAALLHFNGKYSGLWHAQQHHMTAVTLQARRV